MKNPNDFASLLSEFLGEYLPAQKNASQRTVRSYRDTFKLFLIYMESERKVKPEKIRMKDLTSQLVLDFLSWLERERNISVSSRNQRLSAIRSFFRYAQFEMPEGLARFQAVLALPSKKAAKPTVPHLSAEEMKVLLSCPEQSTARGRRDLCLLCFLYDSACRVQELIDLRVRDVILRPKGIAILSGKGGKIRRVPLERGTTNLLEAYLREQRLTGPDKMDWPVFTGSRGNKLTREGVTYIISKYVAPAREKAPSIPEKVTPHMFRHSRAMTLLQSGVNLIYIRDFLGHTDVKTTEIYAKTDTELKRKAIDGVTPSIVMEPVQPGDWSDDHSLMEWLKGL